MELFKSKFWVAEWKRINLPVLRGGLGGRAVVMRSEKGGETRPGSRHRAARCAIVDSIRGYGT